MSFVGWRTVRRSGVLLVAASMSAAVLAGCGSQPSSGGSSAGQSIILYNGQHPQTVDGLVKDFQQRTGVKVQVRAGGEAELANQILQEGTASPADVFFAENPPALTTLEDKGLLAKVNSSTLAAVLAQDSSTKADWVGVSARESVFAYNTDQLSASQMPSSVQDLAGPAWKGKLGIAPSETDFTPIVTRMISTTGVAGTTDWLQGLKANSKVYASNEDLIAAVNRGEVVGGALLDHYWYRLRDEEGAGAMHSRLGYFAIGDPGALVDISGAAILASSKHQAAAQAFLAYLVSQPAQQIIATSESYEYPLLAGVTSPRLPRPLSAAGPVTPASDLGDGKQALQLMQNAGLL